MKQPMHFEQRFNAPAFLMPNYPVNDLAYTEGTDRNHICDEMCSFGAGVQRNVIPLCMGTGNAISLCRSRAAALPS